MGLESISPLKFLELSERLTSEQLVLNRLCSPRLEILELENLVISSRDRGFQPLTCHPVQLWDGRWDVRCSLITH